MTPSATRWPVAVLGATGAVGQAFIRLLDAHPWFDLVEVAASERSAGKSYRDAAKWLEGTMPATVASLVVKNCTPEEITAPIVFSALDSGVAGEVEPAFARAGRMVLSNAKNYRMDADVPLVIPEVNGDHLALLEVQRANRDKATTLTQPRLQAFEHAQVAVIDETLHQCLPRFALAKIEMFVAERDQAGKIT